MDQCNVCQCIDFIPNWPQNQEKINVFTIKVCTLICPLVMILSTVVEYFFVHFLATREAVVPFANDPIMSVIFISSFRHLEHQNLSIISDSIGRVRILQQFWRRIGLDQRNRSTVGLGGCDIPLYAYVKDLRYLQFHSISVSSD